MTKKIQLTYRIRPELDERFAEYARAKGQTRTSVITSIIEKYLSCKKFSENLRKIHAKKTTIKRKDWTKWKPKGDYVLPSQHEKIKFIATSSQISVSEVMDDILESYLSKVDPSETLDETLEKVFN